MKTENIDYLLTTIQCGSIYKASKFLNVAPQHLRAILNSIEDEVGVKLLVRDKQKGCYVSEQGRYFVEQLEQINNITRDIIDASKAKQGLFSFPEEDELFIFAQSNIHTYLFKGLLEMRRIYESVGKKLRINYLELVSREIINNVLLSSNAVGLITLPDNIEIEDYLPNGLKYIEIAKRNWVVLVAANSPFLRRYKRMTIQDILSCDHVIYQSSLEVEMHTYQYLQQYGDVNVAYSTNNIFFMEEGFNIIHMDSLSTQQGYYHTSVSPIFVAAGPGIKQNYRTERVIRQVDVAPTIATLLGVRMPQQCEGAPAYQIFEEIF